MVSVVDECSSPLTGAASSEGGQMAALVALAHALFEQLPNFYFLARFQIDPLPHVDN
jgi:hypothetical protein